MDEFDGAVEAELTDDEVPGDDAAAADQHPVIVAFGEHSWKSFPADRELLDDLEQLELEEVVDRWFTVGALRLIPVPPTNLRSYGTPTTGFITTFAIRLTA